MKLETSYKNRKSRCKIPSEHRISNKNRCQSKGHGTEY